MNKQYYTCCKNSWCKQENIQWKQFVGCQNYTKDQRNRNLISGPPKGFVNNLKDKLVNLQNESLQYQFVKKPAKKNEKDYYCLMLRKINNLDKKIQNLEHLFVSHVNRTPNEVFYSKDNEPLYDHMEFYESVRSLVDFANRLKEDILYKQCDNYLPNRNTLHLNDRIQVLDSELQNLYMYLEQLQNCTDEINGKRQLNAQAYQDSPFGYSNFTGGPKVGNKRFSNFKDFRKRNKKKRKCPERYNGDWRSNLSAHGIECCYEADEDSPITYHCSRCNLNPTFFSMSPGNKARSHKLFEHCHAGSSSKTSNCSCSLCDKGRKKPSKIRKNNMRISQSISSCSCDICVNNGHRSYIRNCHSARIKVIKPAKKDYNEEDFSGGLQIVYNEIGPMKKNNKKKQNNKWRNQNITKENFQNTNLGTNELKDIDLGSKGQIYTAVSHGNSRGSGLKEKGPEKISHRLSKSSSKNQENKVIYYELTPDLNIITKRKNSRHIFNSPQEHYQSKTINRNKDKPKNEKGEVKKTDSNTYKAFNFDIRKDNNSNKFVKKDFTSNRNSDYFIINGNPSLGNKYTGEVSLEKKNNLNVHKNNYSTNVPTRNHLHIKIHKKKEFEEDLKIEQLKTMKIEGNCITPENYYKYSNNGSQFNHRKHGGFCHFETCKFYKKLNGERYSNYQDNNCYYDNISENDSFETLEEYESDSDNSLSQYKLFLCSDSNCVDKLDSDELIMLMKKTDMKYRRGDAYKLNISESVNKINKSGDCEKCSIRENTIFVTPQGTKSHNNNMKGKIILKQEHVECTKCKTKNNEEITDVIEYSETEIYDNRLQEITKNMSNAESRDTYVKSYNQNNVPVSKNQTHNTTLVENASHSQSPKTQNYNNNKNQGNINSKSNDNKTGIIVACSDLNVSPSSNIVNTDNFTKPLELQGFGNSINVNIERGPYFLNPQPDTTSNQVDNERPIMKDTQFYVDTHFNNIPPIDGTKNDQTIGISNKNSLNLKNQSVNNIPDKLKAQSSHRKNNKSKSVMELAINSEQVIQAIPIVKSEISTLRVNSSIYNPTVEDDTKVLRNIEKSISSVGVKSRSTDENGGKSQQPKNHAKITKDLPLNCVKEENSVIMFQTRPKRDYHWNQEKNNNDLLSNMLPTSGKNMKPVVSTSRVKRNRLKYNKKFGPSLSKVSSIQSNAVLPVNLCPVGCLSKKSHLLNPGKRISKTSKRRYNGNPRVCSFQEESLSGIPKPKMKIVVQESYQNSFEIPSNDYSNSQYKVASITNYLSSTVGSESSYSTLNWEKVAHKLKEDDTYYNDIA